MILRIRFSLSVHCQWTKEAVPPRIHQQSSAGSTTRPVATVNHSGSVDAVATRTTLRPSKIVRRHAPRLAALTFLFPGYVERFIIYHDSAIKMKNGTEVYNNFSIYPEVEKRFSREDLTYKTKTKCIMQVKVINHFGHVHCSDGPPGYLGTSLVIWRDLINFGINSCIRLKSLCKVC